MQVISFPDVVGLVAVQLRQWLSDQHGIDIPVGSQTPTPRPDEYIRLWDSGGVRRDLVTDRPTLTVETYAARNGRAYELADLARGWLHSMVGVELAPGSPVYRVEEFSRPANLPDPTTSLPRYTATYQVDLRGISR